MARRVPSTEAVEIAEESAAIARHLRAHGAVSEFLDWIRQLPSVDEVRVAAGDDGATVWAIQDVENLDEAQDAYLRLSQLLARDDTPYLSLLVGPRLESTESTLSTAHKL